MGWQRARFKGQDVWARVDGPGCPAVDGGRLPIRYQARAGAKVYRASADRVELVAGAQVEDLDDGAPAESARPASGSAQGAGSSKGTARGPGSAKGRGSAKGTAKVGSPGGFGKAGTRTAAQAALAVEAARKLVATLEGKAVLCFTDGACKGNPGPAGAGAVVWVPGKGRGEASQALGRATNNVAELTAIGLALELLDERGVPIEAPGAILTDSAYAHGVLVRGWKAKANQALVAEVKSALARRPGLDLHWIAGHVGIEGNERADLLANAGVAGVTEVRWSA